MLDDTTQHEPPGNQPPEVPDRPEPPDWQAECIKAREAAELFRSLLHEVQVSLFDARVDLTMAMRELQRLRQGGNNA